MILPNRVELKKRTAETLTDPNFCALTTMDIGDGENLPLEVKIKDTPDRPRLEFQRRPGTDTLDYHLVTRTATYTGKIDIGEQDNEFVARVHLTRFNGKRVVSNKDKHKRTRVGYTQDRTFYELYKQHIHTVNYWVPTILNHIGQNVDSFIPALMQDDPKKKKAKDSGRYRIKVDQKSQRRSPDSHFRSSCHRNLVYHEPNGTERVVEVRVTGTFVKTDWQQYQLQDIEQLIAENAEQITPMHFRRKILPNIAEAGHSIESLQDIYQTNRD